MAAVVVCVIALARGVSATADLEWPIDPDQFRDLAQAQTIRDGAWLQDPFYRGEWIWYSPLLPASIAAVSFLTDRPAHIAATRGGAYLNLLGPVAFYLLAADMLGPAAALLGLIVLVFFGGTPPWAWPTYSPWIFASNFSQALFYATLLVFRRAMAADRVSYSVATGILLGLTFLAHTAPALLIGIIVVASALVHARAEGASTRRELRRVAVIAAVALATASPFLVSILGRYRLHIVNAVPLIWSDPASAPEHWPALAAALVKRPLVNLALVSGFVALFWRTRVHVVDRTVIASWLIAALLLFAYAGLLWPALHGRGTDLPPLIPAFHFLFYARAAEALLVGFGAAVLLSFASALLHSRDAIAISIAAVVLCAVGYPRFAARDDFVALRRQSEATFASPEFRFVIPWIRANTRPDDVFLTAESAGLSIVGPAGRKSVLTPRAFSNPYVAYEPRLTAQREMWAALGSGACDRFRDMARKYTVSYVMTAVTRTPAIQEGECGLEPTTFPGTTLRIYRVP